MLWMVILTSNFVKIIVVRVDTCGIFSRSVAKINGKRSKIAKKISLYKEIEIRESNNSITIYTESSQIAAHTQ